MLEQLESDSNVDQTEDGGSPRAVGPGKRGIASPDGRVPMEERLLRAETIVEEVLALYHEDGRPLPPPTSGRDLANKLQDVA